MSNSKLLMVAATALFVAAAFAKPPASAPAGTTALCKDGSYSSASTKSGACSGHNGVKNWYGAAAGSSAASEPAPAAKAGGKSATNSSGKSEKAAKAGTGAHAVPAPSGEVTGLCKDGTKSTSASKSGACSGHGGVKDWYVAAAAPAPMPPKTVPAPVAKPGHAPPTVTAGGGNGQVWVNADSKVYHCPGDKWYGTTKSGSYMSESSAIAQGYHADHGKACH